MVRRLLRTLLGTLLLVAFGADCAGVIDGSACEQEGVTLVTAAHWTADRGAPGPASTLPLHAESHCHCSSLYGRTTTSDDRMLVPVVPVSIVQVGLDERTPIGPDREPPLRPPEALLA
ncbi:MAG: hypothetical protein ACYC5V_04850 [Gemmatimonadaceae bacterium]